MYKQEKLGLISQIKHHINYKIKHFIKDNINQKNKNILLLGDSMIEYLNIELFSNNDILNLGISGLTSKALYINLDNILNNLEPTDLFITIGANDLIVDNISLNDSLKYINSILKDLNLRYPNINKYFISLTPIVNKKHDFYKSAYLFGRDNKDIIKINEEIKKILFKYNFKYIDIYHQLLDKEGNLRLTLTTDGIHLNKEGYLIYTKNILNNL